jgi:hypothetical protein
MTESYCFATRQASKFYYFRLVDIGFDVKYFQKGGLSDNLRKNVYVLLRIDSKPTAYSIFAKVESGMRGSTLDKYMSSLEQDFHKEMKAHKFYAKRNFDIYCHFVAKYFYKLCVDWEWKKAYVKWEPKRYAKNMNTPEESSVDEVTLHYIIVTLAIHG